MGTVRNIQPISIRGNDVEVHKAIITGNCGCVYIFSKTESWRAVYMKNKTISYWHPCSLCSWRLRRQNVVRITDRHGFAHSAIKKRNELGFYIARKTGSYGGVCIANITGTLGIYASRVTDIYCGGCSLYERRLCRSLQSVAHASAVTSIVIRMEIYEDVYVCKCNISSGVSIHLHFAST